MDSKKLKYTWWHYLIGIGGLIIGAVGSDVVYRVDLPLSPFMIIYPFVLIAAIVFLFIRTEMTYLMYTGMGAILCLYNTFYPITLLPFWYNLIWAIPYWFSLGYLVYKYLDFRKTSAAEKKTYEKEPHKEVLKEVIAAIIDKLDTGKGISYSSVVETAMKTGINQESVEAGIKELMDEGRCYEPKIGILRKVEKPLKKETRTGSVPYYYKVLGVSKNSSLDEIKEAYRRLAMIYHPDISADPDGDKKFKEVTLPTAAELRGISWLDETTEVALLVPCPSRSRAAGYSDKIKKAYEVLSNPEKRAQYDRFEKLW